MKFFDKCIWLKIIAVVLTGVLFSVGKASGVQDTVLNVVDMTASPETLNPFRVYGTQSQSLYRQIYDNLVDRDSEGNLIPGIAKHWEYSGNGIWSLRIREDVYFQDGSRLTSRDVKFSMDWLIGPKSVAARRRDFSFIRQVEAVGEHEVKVHTQGPVPTFPAQLAQFSMVLPERLVRKKGEEAFFREPIGAGPFRLVHINRKEALLQRNPRYYRGKPKIEKVVFHFLSEPQRRLKTLLAGNIQLVTNLPPKFAKEVASDPRVSVAKKHSLQFNFANFDTTSPGPLKDRRVRRALAHWTNLSHLVRFVAHGNGRPIPTPVMPQDFGFHPGLQPYAFDPIEAKKLLIEAGYASGFSLSAVASDEMKALGEALADQWIKLGVRLRIRVLPRSQALQAWIEKRDYNVFLFSPTNLLQDASYHLKIMLDPRHPINRFQDEEGARLARTVNGIADLEQRRQVLFRMQEIIRREVPAIVLYQRVNIYALSDRLKSFEAFPDTILRLHSVNLEGFVSPRKSLTGASLP